MTVKKLEALEFGLSVAKNNIPFFFGVHTIAFIIFFLMVIFSSILQYFEHAVLVADNPLIKVTSFFVQNWIVLFLFSAPVVAGFIKIGLDFCDYKKAKGNGLFYGYAPAIFLKNSFAQILIQIVSSIGFAFFIIPGVILSIKFGFVTNFIVDKKCNVLEAFGKSSAITKGIKWELFCFYFFTGLFGMIPIGLGIFSLIVLTLLLPDTYVFLNLGISATIVALGISIAISVANVAWNAIYRQLVPKLDDPDGKVLMPQDDLKMAA